jgi:transposase-like protein
MRMEQTIRQLWADDPDMSISALGREIGVHHGTVSRWLHKLGLYRETAGTRQTASATATHAERMRAKRQTIAAQLLSESDALAHLSGRVIRRLADELDSLDHRNLIDLLAKSGATRLATLGRHLELDKHDTGDPKVDTALSMAQQLITALGVHGPDPNDDGPPDDEYDEQLDGPR